MKRLALVLGLSGLLGGCSAFYDKYVQWSYEKPETFPVIYAVGYAPISLQHGTSDTEKMLNAIRASKLDAYRELAEQVYGQHLDASTTMSDMIINNDALKSRVNGVIRGAEIVKVYTLDDIYTTELKLSMENVYNLLEVTSPKRELKSVTYY